MQKCATGNHLMVTTANILSILSILSLLLIPGGIAISWSGEVGTDFGSWSINRQSNNVSFLYEQSVEGQIKPVSYRGRNLSGVHSSYGNVNLNDVEVMDRTAASEGDFSSKGYLFAASNTESAVFMEAVKPAGSEIYTIDFYESWPVWLGYSRSINYAGRGINNRDFAGNNKDFVDASFLYGKEFAMGRALKMSLERMNATVLVVSNSSLVNVPNESIMHYDVMATRSTNYTLLARSTGIASLKYRQVGSQDELLSGGDERYVGDYEITRKINMNSGFFETPEVKEEDWAPCCFAGYGDLSMADRRELVSAKGVFDCSCPKGESGVS